MSRNFCAEWRKICKQISCKAVRRALCGVALNQLEIWSQPCRSAAWCKDRGGTAWRINIHWYIEPSVEPRVLFYFVLKNGGKCGIIIETQTGVQTCYCLSRPFLKKYRFFSLNEIMKKCITIKPNIVMFFSLIMIFELIRN